MRIGVGHPGVKDLVHAHVLNDFAKDEQPWVEALCAIIADNAELLAKGQDASFQNKVHLGMDYGDRANDDVIVMPMASPSPARPV